MTVFRRRDELKTLLFGDALNKREAHAIEELGADLDACLRGVMLLVEDEVGECDALRQAQLEWSRIVDMDPDYAGIACERAALLFALHKEPAVRAEFAHTDRWLVRDLRDRVLPIAIPKFVAGMAQNPSSLVALVGTLCELWPGEALGVGLGGGVNEEEGAEDGTEDEGKRQEKEQGQEQGKGTNMHEAIAAADDGGDAEG